MSEIINISAKAVTARKIVEKALELDGHTHAYLVTVDENGELNLFGSGDLSKLPAASLYMQYYATKYARGEIE